MILVRALCRAAILSHAAPVVVAQDMLHVAPRLIVRTMWADVRQAVALDYTILMFTNKQAVEGLVP